MEWWDQLLLFDKIIWGIAIFSGVIFLIQLVLTFVGMDSGTAEADFDGDIDAAGSFHYFTFRNFINFFTGFSWAIIAFRGNVENKFLLVFIGVISGLTLVGIVLWIFYLLSKTVQSGNLSINNCLNLLAEVYLPIPGKNSGMGKIQIKVQGSIREMDAMTAGEKLTTGQMVKVVEIANGEILIVEKI